MLEARSHDFWCHIISVSEKYALISMSQLEVANRYHLGFPLSTFYINIAADNVAGIHYLRKLYAE